MLAQTPAGIVLIFAAAPEPAAGPEATGGAFGDGAPFAITLTLDKDAKTLTVADNGVGMGEADLTGALGTIASSGTRAFDSGPFSRFSALY